MELNLNFDEFWLLLKFKSLEGRSELREQLEQREVLNSMNEEAVGEAVIVIIEQSTAVVLLKMAV